MAPKKHSKAKKTSAAKNFFKTGNPQMFWAAAALCCGLCAGAGYMAGSRMWVQRQATQVAASFQSMPGVMVDVAGGAVVLSGTVETMEAYNKCRMMVRAMNAGNSMRAMNMVQITDEGKTSFIAQLRRDIRNRKVRARFVGNRLVLEGMVRNEFDADKAVELTKAALMLGANGSTRETASNDPSGMSPEGFVILDTLRIRGT